MITIPSMNVMALLAVPTAALGCAACSAGGPTTATLGSPAGEPSAHVEAPSQDQGRKTRREYAHNLKWGEEVKHVQTAIQAIRAPQLDHITFFFFARNTSDQPLVRGDWPPFKNRELTVVRPDGVRITSSQGRIANPLIFLMPPHVVLEWQKRVNHIAWLLSGIRGRVMLIWSLNGVESAPLHLRVHDDEVTVYKDAWKTVKFRFTLGTDE